MKHTFTYPLFLLFLCFSQQTFGQSLIRGKVESDGKPLAFANVLLLSAKDSSLVKGMVTNESGTYHIADIKPGAYILLGSMVGYKKSYSSLFQITSSNDIFDLKTVTLQEDSRQLHEVTVEASKPLFEQQLDKLVVNVGSSITAAGSTALDILERSPGISLNRQNNSLSMSGKTGVLVMINGKLSRLPMEAILQMLSGMNAGNIEKIELITAPSASYDAEGNAGIINIVLKKNTDIGTNGNYSVTMGYGWYERPAASVNVNHRREKVNVFADGSFLWDHYWFSTYTSRRFIYDQTLQQSSNVSNRNTHHLTYNGRLGFEYSLGTQTSLSGLIAGFNNRQEQFALNEAAFYQAKQIEKTIDVKDHEINQWRHLMGNVNLEHSFASKGQLSVDVDYLLYHHNNPHWYTNAYQYRQENTHSLEQLNSSKRTPLHLWVGKADYSKNFNEHSKLETGVKATFSRLKNNVLLEKRYEDAWQREPEFSENLEMLEDIGAAYMNFHHKFDANTSLQTGLRWEYTHTDLTTTAGENIVKRRYHYLFPSVFISRDLNKNNSMQFSYSRRITRPTYNDLAPVFTFVDPYTSLYGNTSLKPAITNALQASYQYKKKYMLALQYSHDANAISWVMRIDPEQNKQYTYKDNINRVRTYSLNLTIPLSISSWWQMQNNLMGNWQQSMTDYGGETLHIRGYSGQINSTQTFNLPKDFSIEVSALYKSRSYFGILVIKPYGFVNVGIQKKINNKGTLRVSVSDLFWTMPFEAINDLPALDMYQNIGFRFEPRVVRLTYSRNFGNSQVKAAKQRATGSEEERRRVQ
ncbi:outer membrane beta-barrel family protein [Rhodocytophaga aerolata]|uniref:Outer membrane beta-barrel family protein n=1 Tax=Rhodocytophaga aerolata TaxID=455078 RepID=A0ABT8RHY3_9BACT|nr:outer membrane beta-barrel family protein [Rhodocytophaga aerolata]MDO1450778.1 outer membrane beta-barrel family protein [Rhodocytophaga aerolata]